LSIENHPDKYISKKRQGEISEKEYQNIEETYRIINVAYNILKNEDSKKDYNHYLDNPEDRYYNYYRFYRNKYRTNVDIRLVIFGFLVCWSLFQWVGWTNSYKQVVLYMLQDNKYRLQAKKLAIERQLLSSDGKLPKSMRRLPQFSNPNDTKAEIERIFKSIIEENVDVRGGMGKPKITDVALIQFLLLPKILYEYIKVKWIWYYRRNILKAELDDDEKWIMIRKNLEIKSDVEFEYMRDKKGEELWKNQCWDKTACKQYQNMVKEKERLKMAESGRAKQYRRYMKKGGDNKMTFNENDDGGWED